MNETEQAVQRLAALRESRVAPTEPTKAKLPNRKFEPESSEAVERRDRVKQESMVVQHAIQVKSRLANAGIPARHRDVAPKLEGVWGQKMQAISGQLGSGFLIALLGPRGTGKTQMAACLMRQAAERGDIRYARAMDLFLAIKGTYRRDGMDERTAMAQFIAPELLVIDEAHERGETPWEDRVLTYVIDLRYGELRDTLLISNMTEDAFRVSIGASIYSRLVETGGIVVADWKSFRGVPQ